MEMPHWSLKGRDVGSGCLVVRRVMDIGDGATIVILGTVELTPIASSIEVFSARFVADPRVRVQTCRWVGRVRRLDVSRGVGDPRRCACL